MKRLFFAVALLLTALFSPPFSSPLQASGEPLSYAAAKDHMSSLRHDAMRSKYRHSWIQVADEFQEVYEDNPLWSNRPAALFRSAEALEEMARRSCTRKDAQEAALRFELVAENHPRSVLADDALYRAARIRHELMHDVADCRALLDIIHVKYRRSDHAKKAEAYRARIDPQSPPSHAAKPAQEKAQSAPAEKAAPVKAHISRVFAQNQGKIIKLTLTLDKPEHWKVRHEKGNNAERRLIVEVQGIAPRAPIARGMKYKHMGILRGYKTEYDKARGNTRLIFDFAKLQRYRVRTQQSPFRIIIESTASSGALTDGISPDHQPKPCTATEEKPLPPDIAAQLGMEVRTVIIDPGHGGKDPGTEHNGIVEKKLTLDMAKRVGGVLRRSGYKVVYTRTRDTWVSLSERAVRGAKAKGDIFVSIHINANNKPSISGFETYYLDLKGSRDSITLAELENRSSSHRLGNMEGILANVLVRVRIQESRKLADAIQKQTMHLLGRKGYEVNDNGKRGAPFHVLIDSPMPGVLVELGYCSNKAEARRLKSIAYRNTLAEGIANGIHRYAQELERSKK